MANRLVFISQIDREDGTRSVGDALVREVVGKGRPPSHLFAHFVESTRYYHILGPLLVLQYIEMIKLCFLLF